MVGSGTVWHVPRDREACTGGKAVSTPYLHGWYGGYPALLPNHGREVYAQRPSSHHGKEVYAQRLSSHHGRESTMRRGCPPTMGEVYYAQRLSSLLRKEMYYAQRLSSLRREGYYAQRLSSLRREVRTMRRGFPLS